MSTSAIAHTKRTSAWRVVRLLLKLFGIVAVTVAALVVYAVINDPCACTSRVVAARSDMKSIASALASYKHDVGSYPRTRQGLDALVHPPVEKSAAARWRGYLKELPEDPWGNPYIYASPSPGGEFYLLSHGADGKPGGAEAAADIAMLHPTHH